MSELIEPSGWYAALTLSEETDALLVQRMVRADFGEGFEWAYTIPRANQQMAEQVRAITGCLDAPIDDPDSPVGDSGEG